MVGKGQKQYVLRSFIMIVALIFMNKKINIVLIIALFLIPERILFAQDFTNPQRRFINQQVYSLLENYSRYGRLSSNYKTIDEDYLESFSTLFAPSAMVFNDILPYNRMDHNISINEYLPLIEKYYPSGIGFRLHDIQISIPYKYQYDKYRIDTHLYKEIYGTTSQNANYKDTLSLTFNIEFGFEDSNPEGFKIMGIDGANVGRTLRLFILDDESGNPLENVKVEFNNHTYFTNNSGRIEFKNLDPNATYNYSIQDKNYETIRQPDFYVDNILKSKILVDPSAEYFDPNEIVERMSILTQRFIFSLHFSPSVTDHGIQLHDVQNINTESSDLQYSWVANYYFGLKTGVNVFSTQKYYLSLLMGLEYSHFSSRVDINDTITQPNLKDQLIKTTGFSFPLHFLASCNLIDRLNLNVESGINLNFLTYSYNNTGDPDFSPVSQHWRTNNFASVYISPSVSWDLSNVIEIYGGPSLIVGLNELPSNRIQYPFSIEKSTLRVWSIEIGLRYRFTGMNDSSNYR